jgi:large conductance mechanosensitive channel
MRFFQEFKKFVARGNVVDLAVGVVIGGAFGKIIASLVSDIILPPLGWLLNGVNFRDLKWILQRAADGTPTVAISYGNFLQTIIEFLIVALSVFILIQLLSRLRPKEDTTAQKMTTEVKLLQEIRDLLKQRS